MKKIGWLLVFFLIIGVTAVFLSQKKTFFLDPRSPEKEMVSEREKLKVFGFLPTWMVGKTREYSGKEIDDLIFLGIEVDVEGNLVWETQSKKINSESYEKQKEKIKADGGKNILGIKLFKDDDLDVFLRNKTARDNLIEQLKFLVEKEGMDGVNIDFEYQNSPVAILNQSFFDFLDEIRMADIGEISVDVFMNTIIKGDLDSLRLLVGKTDYLILMAYDFHRPGSDFAGSVAPIRSKPGERNILEAVEKIIEENIEKRKIVLAYPLYGYEWKTYTSDLGAAVKTGWSQMSSWKRTKELIAEKKLEVKWDDLSMTPWLVFEENEEIHQIYFENEKSLEIKSNLVKDNNFGGLGFWALGYEGEDNVLLVDD